MFLLFPLFLYVFTLFIDGIVCLDNDQITLPSACRLCSPGNSDLSILATPESKTTSTLFHGWEVPLFVVILFVVLPLVVYTIQHWHYKNRHRGEYELFVA